MKGEMSFFPFLCKKYPGIQNAEFQFYTRILPTRFNERKEN